MKRDLELAKIGTMVDMGKDGGKGKENEHSQDGCGRTPAITTGMPAARNPSTSRPKSKSSAYSNGITSQTLSCSPPTLSPSKEMPTLNIVL